MDLYDEAIYQLERAYPPKIQAMDEIERSQCVRVHERTDDLFRFANLVESLFEMEELHSRLLYQCCLKPLTDIVHGVESLDGTTVRLSPTNLDRCLEAIPILTRRELDIRCTVKHRVEVCSGGKECRDAWPVVRISMSMEIGHHPLGPNPLFLYLHQTGLYQSRIVCQPCKDFNIREADIARQNVLDNLCDIFGMR